MNTLATLLGTISGLFAPSRDLWVPFVPILQIDRDSQIY